jgi:type IV pilus assembly protein PilY1
LVDSIPSDVAVLKNANGNIHRIYVGDTGGAVWRVDLAEGNDSTDTNFRRNNWFITKLAELGTDGAPDDRRFFHAPDIVETFDGSGDFDGILIESGDRAHPNETSVSNYMFYIKDRLVYSGAAAVKNENAVSDPPGRYVFDSLADQTACVTGLEVSGACNASLPNGWKIQMARSGEKGLSTPLVDGGRVFFTTFRPPAAAATCAPTEGQGSVYVVNLADGTAYANNQRIYEIGPGIPPGAILIGDVILLPGGGIDLHDLDGDGIRDQTKLPQSLAKKIFQIYWREPGIDKL